MTSWITQKWSFYMEQEFKNSSISVAIIGAGASGCIAAYFLLKAGFDVTLFDFGAPLRTLLPTGGGRCNLAHAEYDFKELAKNYPRGEKFLYSVFSKFSTYDTIALFEELGVETYAQDDGRIFPKSNSAKDVREKILARIKKAEFIKEKVKDVIPLDAGFKIKTDRAEYFFTHVIISSGGKSSFQSIKHNIIPFTPSLVGLNADIKGLSGVCIKDVFSNDFKISGDILFTHFGISGPLIYKISSINARASFPYKISLNLFSGDLPQDLPHDLPLQEELNNSPHKELKNILSKYLPQKFVKYLLGDLAEIKAHKIDGKTRDWVLDRIHNFELNITGSNKGEETVTAGGYNLDEISSKTMESKLFRNLYFTGECLDIDGFCGGFNLQNAWSTAYIAAQSVICSI